MNIDISTITPIIEGIAQKLGVAAEQLWEILVKQSIANGIGDLIIFLTLGIITFAGCKFLQWIFRKDKDGDFKTDEDYLVIGGGLVGTSTLLTLIISICYLVSSIKHFINPGYYAFIDILCRLK